MSVRPSEAEILVAAPALYEVVERLVEEQDGSYCDICGAGAPDVDMRAIEHYEDCIVLLAKTVLAKARGNA